MIKNKLAIQVWREFVEEHGRKPTVKEFIDMGYSKTHYYTTRDKIKELSLQEATMNEQREERPSTIS